jgi:cytochrome c oxidase subunit IV
VFQVLAGLVAIFNDEFFVVAQNYTFDLDVSAWGWIHLLIGLAILATGFGLFGRRPWAGVATIMLCMLSAIVNFFFIPYYPIWSLLVIGLDIWVIWAVTRPGALEST